MPDRPVTAPQKLMLANVRQVFMASRIAEDTVDQLFPQTDLIGGGRPAIALALLEDYHSTLMLRSALQVRAVCDGLAHAGRNIPVIVGGAPFRFDPNLRLEVCAYFEPEAGAALHAEGMADVELATFCGGCDDRGAPSPPAVDTTPQAPALRIGGHCMGGLRPCHQARKIDSCFDPAARPDRRVALPFPGRSLAHTPHVAYLAG